MVRSVSSNYIPVRSHPDLSWLGIGSVRSSISDREQFSYDPVSSCSRFTLSVLLFPLTSGSGSANLPNKHALFHQSRVRTENLAHFAQITCTYQLEERSQPIGL